MSQKTTTQFLGGLTTLGLATLFASPAQAASLGGTLSVFLDCNNDGMAHVRNETVSGWQYTQDARGDNTDGPLYDMLGMASTVTDDGKVVVVMNGNTSIDGEGTDRGGNSIAWGDLFFTAEGLTFEEAQDSGQLFAINFSQANDSDASEAGVYQNVVAKGVGMHNFGHRTYENYMNLVDDSVDNFFGDIQSDDLGEPEPYYNVAGPGYNVIDRGTRAYDDGFTFVDAGRLSDLGFDSANFDNQGDNLIAFEFNLAALTKLPPLTEQAEQLGVDWIWDDRYQTIEDEFARLDAEQQRIWDEEIKDHHRENKNIRANTPGFAEIWENRQAAKDVRDANKERQGLLNAIAETEVLIAEQEDRKLNDPTWNNKDKKYLDFLNDEVDRFNNDIASIETEYGSALDTAQQDWQVANGAYRDLLDEIRADHPEYVFNENEMAEPKARRKEVIAERDLRDQNIADLEQEIQDVLAGARQQIVAQASADEQALEEEYGVRTSASDRNATTLNEFEEPVDVPEPSALAGLMLFGLGFGGTQLRRRKQRIN
ncbi:PEP-CTERM sorting domain-containing protein [Roseofilum casamattae]|uniref:PEP-CTERM sorting domain-containing protein n=1 Tax=Roseofilum casamattae BLCC-M143 TaxID=3022442 RepID=A0ABT7BTA0_9CYAN|nr:PEP-CTERM sorting domain-containing protein [Roseofilum casamattae]MDJ1182412.1 PEP-CTERM sorting domain-containing protein [Roseofilum casamattae BLCC-M143]